MQAGWYPDPTGRHELRYHNGAAWTADVATNGVRGVDPWGTLPSPAEPAPGGGSGLATAAMTLGIVAAAVSAVLVFFFVAFPIGVVALIFGIVALRQHRRTGRGRGAALTGLVLGAVAIVVSSLSVVVFWDEIVQAVRDARRELESGGYDVEVTGCDVAGTTVVVAGTLTNRTSRTHDYVVTVEVLPRGSSQALARSEQALDQVEPDELRRFEADVPLDSAADVRCSVDRVRVR